MKPGIGGRWRKRSFQEGIEEHERVRQEEGMSGGERKGCRGERQRDSRPGGKSEEKAGDGTRGSLFSVSWGRARHLQLPFVFASTGVTSQPQGFLGPGWTGKEAWGGPLCGPGMIPGMGRGDLGPLPASVSNTCHLLCPVSRQISSSHQAHSHWHTS